VEAVQIDRIAPTRRPEGPAAGYQRWRHLAFVHWRLPPVVLRPLVPDALAIDTFDGDAFVGIVPFTMQGVRPRWAPAVPGVSSFHETNVRTYVHRGGVDPGVWFFSLDAANRLAVAIARTFWHLPYHHARMTLVADDGEIRYASQRRTGGAAFRATCQPRGEPGPAAGGTLEHFLIERYILYAQRRDGTLRSGQVHHAPYQVQVAELPDWDESLLAAAGIERPGGVPLVHYALGVDVEIFPLQ
jgi:uncharacterized protein YqjF (DUF2071 family)